ncbi:MAG: VOC family protein [Candidatus Eiseniibacteriota bacterium]
MEPRLSFLTLGVRDMTRATRFYADVLKLPPVRIGEDIAFFELGKTWLALYPRELLAADAGVPADAGISAVAAEGPGLGSVSGFPGFTLAHNVRSEAEVDALLAEAVAGGARLVKAGKRAEWGGYSGYFADPDGFLWEIAWNPKFPHV